MLTTARFKQPLWIVPLAIAALVAAFGWWGNLVLRHTIEGQLKEQLNATLVANATALEVWMSNQKQLAATIASGIGESPELERAAAEILNRPDQPPGRGFPGPGGGEINTNELELAAYLRARLAPARYERAQLVSPNFRIDGQIDATPPPPGFGGPPLGLRRPIPITEAHSNNFAQLFNSQPPSPVIIVPYKPELFFPAGPGRGRRGGFGGPPGGPGFTNRAGGNFPAFGRGGPNGAGPGLGQAFNEAARRRRGDQTLMQVAAPIFDGRHQLMGALALVINPTNEFTKILSVSRSGQTGETYAFDQTGLLLSESRFDDQLRKLKVLDETNTTSACNVRLHDPSAEPVDGVKPLTRIVADAVTGEEGVDVTSSRDYRGVMVVGAWRWLPEGFGIATQMDASEAYQPLRVLKLLFTLLCLLLVLCATGMFVFTYTNFTFRRRLSQAELKLQQLGQYMLEEKIGEGGMGVVYRARHALLRRDTAVKLLTPDRADPISVARFEREVVITCQLTHPNTIQIFDYGHTPEGIFYYAMEFLEGLNLHDLVGRFGPQPESRVIYVLAQVCESLAEAHSMGLVHRDIKPANVFLCSRGGMPDWVKVLDFGLVRRFDDGSRERTSTVSGKGLEGTPWFMPPEAIKDSTKNDPRSDIYSVAAVGYFLLTARYVFEGDSIFELCEKHLKETAIAPSQYAPNRISPELDHVILKCLEKDPALRPQSAREMRDLLMKSPEARGWTEEARAAWWAQYRKAGAPRPGQAGYVKPTPTDVRVDIDLASRV